MQLISSLCLGVLGLVSLAVALRLLLLASRTRQLPEFLIGFASGWGYCLFLLF